MHDHAEDYHQAGKVTWITLVVNFLLGVGKVIAGIVGNSWAVIADGIHTISDMAPDAHPTRNIPTVTARPRRWPLASWRSCWSWWRDS